MAEQDAQKPEKQISIQKIYLKDFSFESPRAPEVFTKSDWAPKTDLNLRSVHTAVDANNHEVVLTITVDTKHEDQTLFLVELHQAGLFHIAGYEGEEMATLLGSFCPNVLFPYARESISAVITKGGFPEFVLQPINFDALYAQSRQQIAEQAAAQVAAGSGDSAGTH